MPTSPEITRQTARQVLELEMQDNDAEADTICEYLVALVRQVWTAQDGFSGKRPFGNSGWDWDLYIPLIKAGLIRGRLDEDGYVADVDDDAGDLLILAAINELGRLGESCEPGASAA